MAANRGTDKSRRYALTFHLYSWVSEDICYVLPRAAKIFWRSDPTLPIADLLAVLWCSACKSDCLEEKEGDDFWGVGSFRCMLHGIWRTAVVKT